MEIHKKIESFIKKDEIWRRILFFMFVFLTVFWFIILILFFCTRIHTHETNPVKRLYHFGFGYRTLWYRHLPVSEPHLHTAKAYYSCHRSLHLFLSLIQVASSFNLRSHIISATSACVNKRIAEKKESSKKESKMKKKKCQAANFSGRVRCAHECVFVSCCHSCGCVRMDSWIMAIN